MSHTERSSFFRVGSFHLSRSFAAMGYDVAHVSSPYSALVDRVGLSRRMGERRSAAAKGATLQTDGVLDLVPNSVLPAVVVGRGVIAGWYRSIGFENARFVLVDEPKLWRRGLFGPASTVIYRSTDIVTGRVTRLRQAQAVRECDGVVATSEVVLESMGGVQAPTLITENGVDVARFSEACGESVLRDGVAYIGAMDRRFDWNLVRIVASPFP